MHTYGVHTTSTNYGLRYQRPAAAPCTTNYSDSGRDRIEFRGILAVAGALSLSLPILTAYGVHYNI